MPPTTLAILPAVDGLLLAIIALPLVVAAALAVAPARDRLRRLVPWAALPAVVVAVGLEPGHTEVFDWLLLGTRLELDATGRVFVLFTGLLWWLAGHFAAQEVADDDGRLQFDIFWLLTMSGNIGVTLSRDLPSFLMFFSLMGLSSYGLVIHRGDRSALRAGRIYLVRLIISEALLYAAAVLAATESLLYDAHSIQVAVSESPRRGLIGALFLAGFGVKAGFVLLHISLPPAYQAAPASAGAVLSGAMSKAGVLGWLLFLPAGLVVMPTLSGVFLVGGLIAVYYGIIVGLLQRTPKAMLAYSSISQIGFISLLVGVGLQTPALWDFVLIAVAIYALHHGLNKGALFASVEIMRHNVARRWASGLAMAGFIVPALALAGAPWTSGAMAKWAIKESLDGAALDALGWLEPAAIYASIGTALLMARFVVSVWTRRPQPKPDRADALPRGLWVPWALMVVAALIVPWIVPWPELRVATQPISTASAAWSATWPVLVATAAAAAVFKWRAALGSLVELRVPAGDLLVPIEYLVGRVLADIRRAADWTTRRWAGTQETTEHTISRRDQMPHRSESVEDWLTQWHAGATSLVLLAVLIIALLVFW